MAHSTLGVTDLTGRLVQRKNVDNVKTTSSKNKQNSFANVMAKEQSGIQNIKNDTKSDNIRTTTKSQVNDVGKKVVNANTRTQVAPMTRGVGTSMHNPILAGRTPNDLARIQIYNRASSELQQTQNLNSFMKSESNAGTMQIARNMNSAARLRTIGAGGAVGGFALTNSDFVHTRPRVVSTKRVKTHRRQQIEEMGIGKLSARFESGKDGVAAIGYDRNGGTSYGKYQIASRVGTMNKFLEFLDIEASDLSKRLRSAGPANTGSRKGAMPDEWRAIAKEQPERFEQLQESFINQSHYKPALEAIEKRIGLDVSSLSAAMREVIWSTAVQHGPAGAAKIFSQASSASGQVNAPNYERELISNVYSVRGDQFGSSTQQVRAAVRDRFRQEKQMALNLLDNTQTATRA